MIQAKSINNLEFNKILSSITSFAVLEKTKSNLLKTSVEGDYLTAKHLLDKTNEAYKLLYTYGVSNIAYFDDITDELSRAKMLSTLSMGELLKIKNLLSSSRLISKSILDLNCNDTPILKQIASNIFYDKILENEINSKIINENTMSDTASDKLFQIRKNIKLLNEKIKEKLLRYVKSNSQKFLQDNIISIRSGRYVIPVKSEHSKEIKGFIHDRSQSGSTLFIEPQEVLELNNELKAETLNEITEVNRILLQLTKSISVIANSLELNLVYLTDIDQAFAKAEYSHKINGVYPKINANGVLNVIDGRHPLISQEKVVPISLNFGEKYNFILISGPNTGGKTVTLKLVGLFTLMATCGIFIPANKNSEIAIFNKIYVDIGDEQSIEQNLSTFSSHIKNIIEIVENCDEKSLVLIDEIGAGTDPEEGSALARAILVELLNKKSFGIVTTHYSQLKEFALNDNRIINASMDFDINTFAPLYKIRLNVPGTSNAIEIAKRLGLSEKLFNIAKNSLSNEKISYDAILKDAEKVRSEAEKEKAEAINIKQSHEKLLNELIDNKNQFEKQKEKFLLNAKVQARKLVNEKLETAEDLLSQMKDIFAKNEYADSDLVKMATLKNKIQNEKYFLETESDSLKLAEVNFNTLKVGDNVYVNSFNSIGVIKQINKQKQTVTCMVGSLTVNCKKTDISLNFTKYSKKENKQVTVLKQLSNNNVKSEINLIGMTVDEALIELDAFLDKALTSNLETVRIVHGKGLNILSSAIHNYLKSKNFIKSYRFGKYGEGEHGVTIVTFN